MNPLQVPVRIGGLTPFTTVDYPGQHAAVVFCQGCPWNCPYCHNAHLQGGSETSLSWTHVMDFFRHRKGLLDAVVFSGGEPLAQDSLARAITQARALGYRIGLHTGGSHPKRLRALLGLIDWVGFDFKAPWKRYETITQVRGSGARALESLLTIQDRGIPYETRTTVHPRLMDEQDLHLMATQLEELGVKEWQLQAFRNQGCLDMETLESDLIERFLENRHKRGSLQIGIRGAMESAS